MTLLHHDFASTDLPVYIDNFGYPTPSGTWEQEIQTLVYIWSIGLESSYQPGKSLLPRMVHDAFAAKIHIIRWAGPLPCGGDQVGTVVVTGCVEYDMADFKTIQRARIYLRDLGSLNIQIGSPGWRQFFGSNSQRLFLHEMGHAMGIRGHSPSPNDIMFGDGDLAQQTGLSVSDLNTMRQSYCSGLTRP